MGKEREWALARREKGGSVDVMCPGTVRACILERTEADMRGLPKCDDARAVWIEKSVILVIHVSCAVQVLYRVLSPILSLDVLEPAAVTTDYLRNDWRKGGNKQLTQPNVPATRWTTGSKAKQSTWQRSHSCPRHTDRFEEQSYSFLNTSRPGWFPPGGTNSVHIK